MSNTLVCVGCLYEVSMAKRTVAWEGMPHPSGLVQEFGCGNMQGKGVIELATGRTTEMPDWFDVADFIHLAALLSEHANGVWHVNGLQVYPTITTMYKGTALCVSHLVAEMGAERLKDGSESVSG